MAMPENAPAAAAPPPPSPSAAAAAGGQKRSATVAGNPPSTSFRSVKRRASKACQCCRARKVRCNVVEHGAPCTNCRLDEVECIITESKRRKKFWGAKIDALAEGTCCSGDANNPSAPASAASPERQSFPSFSPVLETSPPAPSIDGGSSCEKVCSGHVPHFIYQAQNPGRGFSDRERRASYASSHGSVPSLTNSNSTRSSIASSFSHRISGSRSPINYPLPPFIKPTPARISPEDAEYLGKKGVLSLPEEPLRSELLKSHFDFVHPYMPILDKKQFMDIVSTPDGSKGRVGLLLFQAVMFAGSAFVDMDSLKAFGYATRKAARKSFFSKARLLYDFDHEQDRMLLVQALLLMTYWYETPDDQKDTWHWMGVAISLSHTIGLHRNPEKSDMDLKRQKLWKRIWWSCFMRDRLVALGMRRPTRIKSEDCDVPMLTLADFDIEDVTKSKESLYWSYEERVQKEAEAARQKELAIMCIEKAKLCVCISQVLSAQYSVLNTNQGSLTADGSTRTTMMLLPKKLDPECCEVVKCDQELAKWLADLPEEAVYKTVGCNPEVDEVLALHRNLLHMVYYTTVSALHRPQVLPSAPAPWPAKNSGLELQEVSRSKVREAASEITRLAEELIELDLVRYLPTTGVTVMLPAVIIHLLDIKSSNAVTRERSLEGFGLCMQVMQGLRQSYSAADYATHFLEAAIKKAEIHVQGHRKHGNRRRARYRSAHGGQDLSRQHTPGSSLGNAIHIPASRRSSNAALTPPPDLEMLQTEQSTTTTKTTMANGQQTSDDNDLQLKLESFLQAPPSPQHDSSLPPPLENPFQSDMLFSTSHDDTPPPHLSIPGGGGGSSDEDNLDVILGSNCDPFLGHYEDGMPLSMRSRYDGSGCGAGVGGGGAAGGLLGMGFDFGAGAWLEEDMSKILEGVEFNIDDVIQVLETEIN